MRCRVGPRPPDTSAAFAAAAALDANTPRMLRIAGEETSPRGLARRAGEATGRRFRPQRAGSLAVLGTLIRILRAAASAPGQVFPPWQGIRYRRDVLARR